MGAIQTLTPLISMPGMYWHTPAKVLSAVCVFTLGGGRPPVSDRNAAWTGSFLADAAQDGKESRQYY